MTATEAGRERSLAAAAETPRNRAVAVWLLVCAGMIFMMVMLGGVTRLTESGLSITQWQPVSGVLPPLSAGEWQAAFDAYRQIPQYDAVHAGMTLAQFKTIYFWEWFHRLWGRLIGVVFLLPFLYFLLRRKIPPSLAPRLMVLFLLGAFQGALGWWMVESGLESRIEVSQYRLAAHLAMAIVIYGAIVWVALDLLRPARHESAPGMRRGAGALLALAFVTLIAGAFTAGLRAGYIDNTFPLMDGHVVPPAWGHLAPWWRNLFENPEAVQFDHRVLAITTWVGALALFLGSFKATLSRFARGTVHALFTLVTIQAAVGVATLLLVVPLPLALAHQLGATLVITAALVMRHALGSPV